MRQRLDVVELTTKLMEIDSTSGRESAVIAWLETYLREQQWAVRRIPVTQGRDDLLATFGDNPKVTMSTHVDTVPPYIAPRLDRDALWGRGACDAKGIAASMIVAAERLRDEKTPIALLFVVGEEVSHDGAEAANRQPTSSKILINGEPTESRLATGTKGAMRFSIHTRGKAAHSAYPHLGESAISKLVRILSEIDSLKPPRDAQLGDTTINIGTISGGVADNVMAPEATAHCMARLVCSPAEFETFLRQWIGDRAELTIGITVPLVRLGTMDGFPTSVAAYATDIPKLGNWGKPYLFGPGSIHLAHRDDEHIRIDELRAASDAYVKIAKTALASL